MMSTRELSGEPGQAPEAFDEAHGDELGGVALLEMHLQDYLFRNWRQHFPHLDLYDGTRGREFVTTDPGVGTIDFLCTDREGDFIVIETKRNLPDRRAIGQILGYMGWVQTRLAEERRVSGILIAGSGSDALRMAIAAVPTSISGSMSCRSCFTANSTIVGCWTGEPSAGVACSERAGRVVADYLEFRCGNRPSLLRLLGRSRQRTTSRP